MTIWTPKEGPAGIKSQWAPPPQDAAWDESNILVYSTQIKQVRIIHLENVYRYMWRFLSEEGWTTDHGDNWYENFYGEARDTHGHKEIRFWWRMQKSPGGLDGQHEYFRYRLFLDVLTTGVKRVEMMYKGKKIKPYVGEFLMWFNTVLELDVNDWFGNHPILGVFEDFFPRMIYKKRIREQEIELRRFSERFVEDLKFFIGLQRANTSRQGLEPNREWY